ncbi:hypothetical protein Tco_0825387 [Tanacetum coccineum]
MLLTRIGDEIYSTVDACKTANEMSIAIERLQQEWSRFVTLVKQKEELDTVSYHKLFDLLKQYQKEANEIRVENIARNANLLALTGQFGNQRILTIAGARETVGSQVVQLGYGFSNCKEFGHFAKECKKPKREQDYTYHKKKMLLCKQAEKGVPLQAEQADWLEDTNEIIDEQELEAHYSFMAKIQEVLPANSGSDAEPLEKNDSNVIPDSSNMCDNDNQADQNADESPKGSTYNGRPTFANPMYIKKAQSEKPCLYEIPYDKCDLENLFALDKEETLTLEQESRSKLNKDLVKPYDYTKQNSLYEIFKPLSREYLDQLAHANKIQKKM